MITFEQATQIRQSHDVDKESYASLARRYGVNQSTISSIVRFKTHKSPDSKYRGMPEEDRRAILQLRAMGYSVADIASRVSHSKSTVYNVIYTSKTLTLEERAKQFTTDEPKRSDEQSVEIDLDI